MTIHELEQRLGIPRANIRYYEKEGLLHPSRGANNYRIYSDADLAALEKICLLRRLEMPIETIRAIQAGELPLSTALARQERLLEGDAARLEHARAVCHAMLMDQASFPTLDPARYEHPVVLAAPPSTEPVEPKRPPVEGALWAFSPWQRLWARTLDLALTQTAVEVLLALGLRFSIFTAQPQLVQFINLLLGWALLLVLEPLLLSTWGATPGKWLLGLELRDAKGRKLSLRQALSRTWAVLRLGYGYEIPVYSWYRLYQCYRTCRDNEPLEYDWEEDNLYYSKTANHWTGRAWAAAGGLLALSLVTLWSGCQSLLPPNRGAVTPEEFYENVNTAAGLLDYDILVDGEGYPIAGGTPNSYTIIPGREDAVQGGDRLSDEPLYLLELDGDGFVSAVSLREEGASADGPVWLPTGAAEVLVLAYAGTEGSGYALARGKLLRAAGSWDTGVFQEGRFYMSVGLELEGYYVSSGFLFPTEDENSYQYSLQLKRK